MMYVFGALCTILMGGWFFYSICVGSKKERLSVAIVWSVGYAIIFALAAFGG